MAYLYLTKVFPKYSRKMSKLFYLACIRTILNVFYTENFGFTRNRMEKHKTIVRFLTYIQVLIYLHRIGEIG